MYMWIMKKKIYNLFFLILFIYYDDKAETFLYLKKNKINVRNGTSFDSEVKYIYKKINLPI